MAEKFDPVITQVMNDLSHGIDDRFNTFRSATNTVLTRHNERIVAMADQLTINTSDTKQIKGKVELIEDQVVSGFARIEKIVSDRKSRDRTKLLVFVTALGLIPSIAGGIAIYRALA